MREQLGTGTSYTYLLRAKDHNSGHIIVLEREATVRSILLAETKLAERQCQTYNRPGRHE